MKRIIIIAIAVFMPAMVSATSISANPVLPGGAIFVVNSGNVNWVQDCIPWNASMGLITTIDPGTTYHPDSVTTISTPKTYKGQQVCGGDVAIEKRLYNLEVAVQELQAQNTALQSKVNLMQAQGGASAATTNATGNTASLEARVSALENITKAIQQSLVFVVQLLTDAINKASGR